MELNSAELIGLEYPGRVENVDNMLKTLGGLNTISKVVILKCFYWTMETDFSNAKVH